MGPFRMVIPVIMLRLNCSVWSSFVEGYLQSRQQSVKLASRIACTLLQGYGQTVPADVGRDCWLLGVWGSLGVYPSLPHPFWSLWPLDGLLDWCTDSV